MKLDRSNIKHLLDKCENNFEREVVLHLQLNPLETLYILSDFYELCYTLLGKSHYESLHERRKVLSMIRYRLNKMVNKSIIEKNRTGTGFLGKTAWGIISMNVYYLKGLLED